MRGGRRTGRAEPGRQPSRRAPPRRWAQTRRPRCRVAGPAASGCLITACYGCAGSAPASGSSCAAHACPHARSGSARQSQRPGASRKPHAALLPSGRETRNRPNLARRSRPRLHRSPRLARRAAVSTPQPQRLRARSPALPALALVEAPRAPVLRGEEPDRAKPRAGLRTAAAATERARSRTPPPHEALPSARAPSRRPARDFKRRLAAREPERRRRRDAARRRTTASGSDEPHAPSRARARAGPRDRPALGGERRRRSRSPRAGRPPSRRRRRAQEGQPHGAGRLDELDVDHLGRVAATRTELEDAGVAAGPLRVARGDLLEQLVDGELVLAERAQRLAPGVQVTALGERDELLDLGLDRLGLRLGGLDALVLDDLLAEVGQQRLPVRGVRESL